MRVKQTVEMSGETLLPPVWRSVGNGLTDKGELEIWVCEGSCLMAKKSPCAGSRINFSWPYKTLLYAINTHLLANKTLAPTHNTKLVLLFLPFAF